MYETIIRPILFKINPEVIHNIVLGGLQGVSAIPGITAMLHPMTRYRSDSLKNKVWDMTFEHPIGLAAGLDKYGSACRAWEMFDFSFAEVGSVTFEPQPGNPKPRLWRIPDRKALQVNFGLNSKGAIAAQKHVTSYNQERRKTHIGISIAKTTCVSEKEAVQDYLNTFNVVYPVADYITLNVSCPNVCNFTEMQHATFVRDLFRVITERNNALEQPKILLVKIGPDLTDQELYALMDLVISFKIHGVVATNLLKKYPADVKVPGKGGLSGTFVREKATETIRKVYKYTKGTVPIVGLGGIYTGRDALEKIMAGATLLQIYTSYIYRGPLAVKKIARELDLDLAKAGFAHYTDAIGIN